MKASNSKDATPAQFLEYLRMRRGIEHARHVRDELGWRWKPSVMLWTIRHNWFSWATSACFFVSGVVALTSDVKSLF